MDFPNDQTWWDFVEKNRHSAKPADLLLKTQTLPKELLGQAVEQIIAWQKAQHKLPTWAENRQIFYPTPLSVEQASSERTAAYKAQFVDGESLADLTGGLGVDSYFFAQQVEKLYYIEQNPKIAETVKYNFEKLGVKNVVFENQKAEVFLEKKDLPEKLSWLYLDPARRNEKQEKIFQLADCEPNVVELLETLFRKTDKILLKTSPFLDIKRACADLGFVQKIAVVSVENECKEVLYFLEKKEKKTIPIHTANWQHGRWQIFDFEEAEEQNADVSYSLPQTYIYEPNASILKAGAFKVLAKKLKINKLHLHSHLYTSPEWVENFAGRSFRLLEICKVNSKELKKILPQNKANLAVRNFPMPTDELRKKLALKDGGEIFIFATTLLNENHGLLICQKM